MFFLFFCVRAILYLHLVSTDCTFSLSWVYFFGIIRLEIDNWKLSYFLLSLQLERSDFLSVLGCHSQCGVCWRNRRFLFLTYFLNSLCSDLYVLRQALMHFLSYIRTEVVSRTCMVPKKYSALCLTMYLLTRLTTSLH